MKNSSNKFFKIIFLSALLTTSIYFLVFIIVDPYDRFLFKPYKAAQIIDLPDRYILPSLTRKAYFDSIIVGTSMSKLLKPSILNSLFDAKFVNLSMPSATPHEQIALFQNFLKYHPTPKVCIVCLDMVWIEDNCIGEWNSNFYFPQHFLRDYFFEDLIYSLSAFNLGNIIYKIKVLFHLKKVKDRSDGYHYWLPPDDQYSLVKARNKIYGQENPIPSAGFEKNPQKIAYSKERFSFEKMKLLEDLLSKLPQETKKILILPPYHIYNQASHLKNNGDRWRAFKQYTTILMKQFPNTFVVDFMIQSKITSNDLNYWDSFHYKQEIADNICHLLFKAIIECKDDESYERLGNVNPLK